MKNRQMEHLKEILLEMQNNKWTIKKDINVDQLALRALDNIGTIDSELRDELILTFLYKAITEKIIARKTIRTILERCLSEEHLFYKVGCAGDDSVFNRSFSILIVRYVIYYHNQYGEDLLSEEELMRAFQDVVRYVRAENDVRGYTKDGGWAHALAHSATALRIFALSSQVKRDELLILLEVVKEKVNSYHHVYGADEAERLVMVVINIMSRGILQEKELTAWLESFVQLKEPSSTLERMYWRQNLLQFLRALYFRIKYKKGSVTMLNTIESVCHILNRFHNQMEE